MYDFKCYITMDLYERVVLTIILNNNTSIRAKITYRSIITSYHTILKYICGIYNSFSQNKQSKENPIDFVGFSK